MKWLLKALASLPTGVMHALAWPVYLALYYVFRYRRTTVAENLAHALPELSADERKAIEKQSYRHLSRLFFEILRSTAMSREEFTRRVSFSNLDKLREATQDWTRQAIVMLVHQGNWEWMLHGGMAQVPVSVDPVYKTLHSPFWDRFMLDARSRFGAEPMTLENIGRSVIRGRKKKRVIVLLADQSGPRDDGYWTEFLHRPASFYRGADKLARTLKLPLIFAQCQCVRPGYYEITFHELALPPHDLDDDELLERYVRTAEQMIREQPETYLWTNRRWKKQPPEIRDSGNGLHREAGDNDTVEKTS